MQDLPGMSSLGKLRKAISNRSQAKSVHLISRSTLKTRNTVFFPIQNIRNSPSLSALINFQEKK
jgi:hypothetical protein